MKKTDRAELRLPTLDQIFEFENGEIIRESLLRSGTRIRGAFTELFSGYGISGADVLNETTRVPGYAGIVTMRDIQFYTVCEHHFAPFFGTADVAYQPGEIITGLGKLVRLVRDVHARRLQIQEIMAQDIANDLMEVLEAKGAFVRLRAKHLCVCSRGPGDDNAWTEITFGLGSLADHQIDTASLHP